MNDYRFGFTGTRHGMTDAQKAALTGFLAGGDGAFHHGDCIGADEQAHFIAVKCGYDAWIHPPTSPAQRAWCVAPKSRVAEPKPYIDRNKDIVLETVSLIAAPAEMEEQPRGGTWSTVRFARKQGKVVVLILPDGTIQQR